MTGTAFTANQRLQWQVSDPSGSAWVSANAGSGKTYVLTQRVLRLLLEGADPASILCLTYTRTASAEMGRRIFDRLAAWAVMPAEALREELMNLQGRPADRAGIIAARTLFARALETPGGLKIQTMHAFCESLLHQFPFEANVPGQFQVLDEQGSDALLKQARESVFAGLGAPGTPLRDALNRLIAHTGGDMTLTGALADVVRKRGLIDDWIARVAPPGRPGRIDDVFANLRATFSLLPDDTAESVALRFFSKHRFRLMDGLADTVLPLLRAEPSSANCDAAELIETFQAAKTAEARASAAILFYLKKDMDRRVATSRVTKSVYGEIPDFELIFDADAALCQTLLNDLNALETVAATEALLTVGSEILRAYRAAKDQQGLLDYDDLIARAGALLARSEAAAWVLYKLDSRIDHILVDEAQDTSPAQWAIIQALAEDFFSGDTASLKTRTIFAVGDDKQSIFSFQGAEPRMLADMRHYFSRRARHAGRQFVENTLALSFRSTRQVLRAVDAVFDQAPHITESVTKSGYVPHSEYRTAVRGRVVVWPRIAALDEDPADDWTQAFDAPTEVEKRLAESIAGEIRRLLDEEKTLPSGKQVRAGEILILVRKRDAFFAAMNRALRTAGIATAGADRIAVSSHIAVLDCLALADVMLLPDDDLQLAACLKSPLIGLHDDDLTMLAAGRKGTLWQRLADSSAPAHRAAFERLSGWRAMADHITPFHFFSRVLGPDGCRAALGAALGSEADDVLDAFLSQALAYERLEPPSLQGFCAYVRAQSGELKREIDERAETVRIMTVHGAKGLEADIVFLADSGGQIVNNRQLDPLLKVADPAAPLLLLRQKKARRSRIEAQYADEEEKQTTDEYRRLLYVAMTRARDCLYLCGIRRKRPPDDSWYALAERVLVPATAERNEDGELSAPFVLPDMMEGQADRVSAAAAPEPAPEPGPEPAAEPSPASGDEGAAPELPLLQGRPGWLDRAAQPPPKVPEPLRPSRALAEPDPADGPGAQTAPLAGASEIGPAMQRGRAIHGLIQYLPEQPEANRAAVAAGWLRQRYGAMAAHHQDWINEATAICNHARLTELFGPGSRAEVPVAGYVETETGRHAVSGRIDRLLIGPQGAWIADFKTDRQVPGHVDQIDPAYITQLALYRHLMRRILANRQSSDRIEVRASLVWTAGPQIMPVSDAMLDRALDAIGVLPLAGA